MGAVVLGRLTEVPRGRLIGWALLVAVLATVSYSARLIDTSTDVVGATNTSPIVVTTESDDFDTGDHVDIEGVRGNTAANGTWEVTRTGAASFTLDGSSGNGRYTSGGSASRADHLYRWSTAIGGLVQYAIIGVLVLVLCRGISPATLGLRRPASWRSATGKTLLALVGIFAVGAVLNVFLEAGEEQGLVPDGWDSDRAVPFLANFVVVAAVAPLVEELTYRGLGVAAVRDAFGVVAAVVVTALAFGLAHGLVVGLPVLTIFGAVLAWLRLATDSLYPAIALHALFNGIALVAAVSA